MFSAVVFLFLLLFASPSTASDEVNPSFREYLTQADQFIKENRQQEAGEALRTATGLAGAKHPFLHMRLAKHHYEQGQIPEAIVQAEKAVTLAPSAKWFKFDLAKYHLAGKHYNKAEEQLRTLLKLDPGVTSGYSALAELYFLTNRDDLARLAMKRAKLLGYKGKDLGEMVAPLPTGPEEDLDRPTDRHMLFRFIKAASEDKAKTILHEIGQGKLFEEFDRERMNEQKAEVQYGMMQSSELPDKVAEPLAGMRLYAPPIIIRTGQDYRIMQRIPPFDPAAWQHIADSYSRPAEENNVADSIAAAAENMNPPAPQQVAIAEKRGEEPATPKKRQTPEAIDALYTLESWKIAWEAADVNGYFAAYSNTFAPPAGITFSAWKEKRQKSLARPKAIKIKISDTVLENLPNNHLLITFKQHYQSENYRDTVIKSLTMVKESTGWKIQSEGIVRELPE